MANLIYLEKAYEQGDYNACFELGMHSLLGRGVDVDEQQAYTFIHEAAHHDVAQACYYLSLLYAQGIGTRVNLEKMFYWLERADHLGHREAKARLGEIYAVMRETTIERTDSIRSIMTMLQHTASSGDASCLYRLLLFHVYGVGVRYDLLAVMRYVVRAWQSGEPHAEAFVSMYAQRAVDRDAFAGRVLSSMSVREILYALHVNTSDFMRQPFECVAKAFPLTGVDGSTVLSTSSESTSVTMDASSSQISAPVPNRLLKAYEQQLAVEVSQPANPSATTAATTRTPMVSVVGLVAMVVCAILWAVVVASMDGIAHFMAIPSGLIAGFCVKQGGRAASSSQGIIAVCSTLVVAIVGQMLGLLLMVCNGSNMSLADAFAPVITNFATQVADEFGMMDALFYAVSLIFAYLLAKGRHG